MSWDSVSDLAINKRIKEIEKSKRRAEWIEWNVSNGMSEADAAALIDHPDTIYTIQVPDYCNSWVAMGPVIERELIGITNYGGTWISLGHTSHTLEDGTLALGSEYYFGERILRAAAIVYLIMNGVKPEDCK